jgi:hypothetical protein
MLKNSDVPLIFVGAVDFRWRSGFWVAQWILGGAALQRCDKSPF